MVVSTLTDSQIIDKSAKATVLFFWQSQCPCVTRYQERIESLSNRYQKEGIHFVAVSSNSDISEETMLRISKERGLKIPIVKDHGGAVAEQVEARTTPTVVLIDASGRIHYKGWIDNEKREGDAERIAYLENAIQDFLKSGSVAQKDSPIFGCRITRSLR